MGDILTNAERDAVEDGRQWAKSSTAYGLVAIIDRLSTELSAAREAITGQAHEWAVALRRANDAESERDAAREELAMATSVEGVCEAFEVLCDRVGIKEVQFFGPPHDDRAFVEVCKHNAASMPPGFRETMKREDWATKGSLAEAIAKLADVGGAEGEI